jgi:hypothetical protein
MLPYAAPDDAAFLQKQPIVANLRVGAAKSRNRRLPIQFCHLS